MEMSQARKFPWKSSSKDVPTSWKAWTASLVFFPALSPPKTYWKNGVSSGNPSHLFFGDTHTLLWPFPCLVYSPGCKTYFHLSKKLFYNQILWPNAKIRCWEFCGLKTSNIIRISWHLVFMSSLQMSDVICAWLLLRAWASQDKGTGLSHAVTLVILKALCT